MLLSPRWTFLIPGISLALIGLILCALALPGTLLWGVALDIHTLLVGTLGILIASQLIWCAVLAKTFAVTEGLLPKKESWDTIARVMTLERLLIGSLVLAAIGLTGIAGVTLQWIASGFGELRYAISKRWIIPSVGLIALAVQCAASSFLLSVLRMARL